MKPRFVTATSLAWSGLVLAVLVVSAAGATPALAQDTDLTGETCLGSTAIIDADGPMGPLPPLTYCVMNGNLGMGVALEIDDIDGMMPVPGMAATVADANLTSGGTGNDPDQPPAAGATFIDWADLPIAALTGAGAVPLGSVEDHRILDFTANADFTMFKPQAGSCLNSGSVLPKEDFTQSYIANNDQYLYFAQERRTNNGNSVYYWLLTKNPVIVVASSDCGSSTRGQVQFNLTQDDVELLVNFPDSSDPAGGGVFVRTYNGADSGYVPARDAVFHPGWGGFLQPVANLAVNIAEFPHDGDDDFGPWGGIDSHGNPVASGSYTTASLAEWAVSLSDLFNTQSLCGQSLYITGMSRSSTGQIGSLTEPSALKDIVGPKLYSFGEITASATVTGSCDNTFTFSASATGIDGLPLDPSEISCSWSCENLTDARPVTVDDPDVCSGSGSVGPGVPATIECTATVTETASGCDDDDSASADVYTPIAVTIAPTPTGVSCMAQGTPGSNNGNIAGGVTYVATASGGSGVYTFSWNESGPNDQTCVGNTTTMCTVDLPDGAYCARTEVSVAADDVSNPLCPATTSETEAVSKQTVFTVSDN